MSRTISFIFFTALLAIALAACENSMKEIEELSSQQEMPEEAKKVESYLSQNGIVKAKLTAPLMLRLQKSGNDSSYTEFPRTLHVDFFDDSIKIESRLDSKYGKYFERLNKVYLRDSVVVISVKGDTLRCHDLWWDQNRQLFYTDTIAYYRSPGKRLVGGKGMEATQDLSTVTFKYPLGTVETAGDGMVP